jgi:hypothetical protein
MQAKNGKPWMQFASSIPSSFTKVSADFGSVMDLGLGIGVDVGWRGIFVILEKEPCFKFIF